MTSYKRNGILCRGQKEFQKESNSFKITVVRFLVIYKNLHTCAQAMSAMNFWIHNYSFEVATYSFTFCREFVDASLEAHIKTITK